MPLVDRPCPEHIVTEAVDAGIDELIFVTSRGKGRNLDYFDRKPGLEASLEAAGKLDYLKEVVRVASLAEVVSIRQKQTLGLGHAVLCAAPRPETNLSRCFWATTLLMQKPAIGQLMDVHAEKGGCVVAPFLMCPRDQTHRYGICDGSMATESD